MDRARRRPAEELLASPELAPYAHKLRVERRREAVRPQRAGGAGAERAPARQCPRGRRSTTGTSRRSRCRSTPARASTPHTISQLLSYLYRPDRDIRVRAVTALFEGLAPRADVLAAAYDALVGDRLSIDRLRGYENPMQPTNMGNELDDETVEAMMTAIEEAYPIARKWFDAKARLLGLDKLELADQYAPIGEARAFSWTEAVDIVDILVRALLAASRRDLPLLPRGRPRRRAPRAGKAAGAYCTSVSKTILPYVLMNYTERLRDVSTLAHEFGHATHNVLALEQQTWRSHRTGIPMAEVPSTFAQSLADDYLLENEADAGTRAALAADRLENAFAAIYRQTVLARFEQRAYGFAPRAARSASSG